ncbi:MAG TPA: cupredoxin domain-containing protein [Candidatus Eisenbacteria bacterium]
MKRSRFVIAVAALLALSAAGSPDVASAGKHPSQTLEVATDASGVQRATVRLHSFYFEPDRIVVHAGVPVELTLHNHSLVVPHNFTITDSSISVSQGVGRKRTHVVRFTPERPGEYEFFCHVGSHAKKGMTGVLVVVP